MLLVIACAAAVGAAVWVRPPHTVSRNAPGLVIGEPGGPVPPGLILPGAGSSGEMKPAPAFALTVLSSGSPPSSPAAGVPPAVIPAAGARLTLSALRGHPVVVNFWGSWCGPCRAEMPLLVKAWHAYAGRGVVVVGFDVDDTPAEARRFLREYNVDYPIVTVPDEHLPRAYGVIGLPTTVFVDATGTIRARQLGGFVGEDGEKTLTKQLDALIAAGRR
ncbi:MAG TPA: TlpA disulfide reductase family protein [bacterium]|nr:TlpA disulfide reductase family protein [bacterium]